jgi:uncharacterized protein YndB with AHSA1/START domain
MAPATDKPQNLPELTFTRTFDAPRALVFKVWTDPYHVAQWWGPHGLTIPLSKVDARVGGLFEVHMLTPDGTLLPSVGEFREVVPDERIVFTSNLVSPEGKAMIEVVNSVMLEEIGSRTRMTLHIKVLAADPSVADKLGTMEEGWTESLERVAAEVQRTVRAAGGPGR